MHTETSTLIQYNFNILQNKGTGSKLKVGARIPARSAGKHFYTVSPLFCSAPSLRGHCSHQGGHKDVQSYCLCVKNWSVDNILQL